MKNLSPKKIYWLLLGLGFLFCVAVGIAQGQTTATKFQLTPALHEFSVDPGDQDSLTLTLHNRGGSSVPFRVYSRTFAANGIDGQVTFGDDDSSSYSAGDWVMLSASDIVVPPNGEQEVEAIIQVPENAEPGGHYASVLFEQVPPSSDTGEDSEVSVATRMAALLYFTVSGEIVEAGQVLAATDDGACSEVICGLDVPSFVDHGPVPFSFIFTNTGNVHVRPKGSITITQFGRKIAEVPVEDRAVLPGSKRKFASNWDRTILIGPYDAQLNLTFGSQDYTATSSASFWAFPWQIFLGVMVVAGATAAIILSRKYHKVKRLRQQ